MCLKDKIIIRFVVGNILTLYYLLNDWKLNIFLICFKYALVVVFNSMIWKHIVIRKQEPRDALTLSLSFPLSHFVAVIKCMYVCPQRQRGLDVVHQVQWGSLLRRSGDPHLYQDLRGLPIRYIKKHFCFLLQTIWVGIRLIILKNSKILFFKIDLNYSRESKKKNIVTALIIF